MNARLAVEEALDTVQRTLTALRSAQSGTAFEPKLAEAMRDVENRRRRLVTLSEMPMRTTEAQEIQQSLATIELDLRPAPADLQDAVRAAVQPLRLVLQRYAGFAPISGRTRSHACVSAPTDNLFSHARAVTFRSGAARDRARLRPSLSTCRLRSSQERIGPPCF
jgi:multidrug efflux pump subunit AcrA (membrane-fusion protein)